MTRRKATKRRGLVLGAGGVLGVAWTIGALAALEEQLGWDPRDADTLVGTSAGSILAALLGCGVGTAAMVNHQRGLPVPAEHAQIVYDIDEDSALPQWPRPRLGSSKLLLHSARHPFSVTPMGAMTSLLPEGRGSLERLHAMIDAACPDGGWAPHLQTWIVAMDYDRGRRVTFGRAGAPSASLADAVAASCANPGWYAPVEIGGRRYVDGGACSPTSLDLVAPLGLDEVYVLSPMTSFEYDEPTSRLARLERRWRRMLTRRMLREAVRVRAAGTSVVLVGPGPEDLTAIGANLMNPRRRTVVLETSLRTSAAELDRRIAALAETG